MNAPDRYEKFVVPEGVQKISLEKDTKVPNAATFTLQREDHTVGNMLRMQLHRDKEVLFAGYKLPHPLEYRMLVKVQTRGRRTPRDVVDSALGDLAEEFMDMKAKFRPHDVGDSALGDPANELEDTTARLWVCKLVAEPWESASRLNAAGPQ